MNSYDRYELDLQEPHLATLPDSTMSDPPEKLLAMAVMSGAVNDLAKCRGRRDRESRKAYADALTWVRSEDETWPYSFVNLCGLLGLPVERTRRLLLCEGLPQGSLAA